MDIPPSIGTFWQAFCAAAGEDRSQWFYEAFHFCDNKTDADELADLVLTGQKQATAGLAWAIHCDGKRPPGPGALSVVTYWDGTPACVIETLTVDLVPFEQVDESFAATEGEGDGSLAYWRRVHWEYFSRECARIGRTPSATMPVACERFKVIYRADPATVLPAL